MNSSAAVIKPNNETSVCLDLSPKQIQRDADAIVNFVISMFSETDREGESKIKFLAYDNWG